MHLILNNSSLPIKLSLFFCVPSSQIIDHDLFCSIYGYNPSYLDCLEIFRHGESTLLGFPDVCYSRGKLQFLLNQFVDICLFCFEFFFIMASSFDRWEKDPFFPAAEEVQESADRMESKYRTWMHAKKNASSMWNREELSRDLRTALGTAKWQLDEFQRAVGLSYSKTSGKESRDRHHEFIVAMEDHISKIEGSLKESALSEGKKSVPWVRLNEGESQELALFLSGSSPFIGSRDTAKKQDHSKICDDSVRWSSKEAKSHGHRRTASASPDIGAWNIAVAESQPNPSSGQPLKIPRKVPSVSGFLSSMEIAPKINWPKNGGKKWKAKDINQESDTVPLHSSQLTNDIHSCYEKSKTCLGGCDDCYDKQLYGWYGVIQRQLQRSHYQMQYSRPVQVVVWLVLLLCLIALIVFLSP